MKKILFTLLTLAVLFSCGENKEPNMVVLTSISLNNIDRDLNIGDSYQMAVTTKPAVNGLNFEWDSSDKSVATISNKGVLKVLSDGTTTITVSYGDLTSSVSVPISREQDYTSFVFWSEFSDRNPDIIAGYYNDGYCISIAKFEDFQGGYSEEVVVTNDTLTQVYLFADYYANDDEGIKSDTVYVLQKNKKNIFIRQRYTKGLGVEKNDPTQYPHPNQDYTSFLFFSRSIVLGSSLTTGYYSDGLCKKIEDMEWVGTTRSYTNEVKVTNDTLTHIYLFFESHFRLDTVFVLNKGRKNLFRTVGPNKDGDWIYVNSSDPSQYPH